MTVATNREVPGTSIHAQIVAQLLDGRTIAPVSEWISALIIFCATFGLYMIRETIGKDHPEIFVEFLLIGMIILFGSLMFWWSRINFPSAELGLMWLMMSLSSVYIEKLVVAAIRKRRNKQGGSPLMNHQELNQ
jgi:CHASE2 domain-containing sensor protein